MSAIKTCGYLGRNDEMAVKAANLSFVREFLDENGNFLCTMSVHLHNLSREREKRAIELLESFCESMREVVDDAEARSGSDSRFSATVEPPYCCQSSPPTS